MSEESFRICFHCKKGYYIKDLDFFDHIKVCHELDHSNSPITTRWYTIEELEKLNLEKLNPIKKEKIIKRPITR